MTLSKTDNESRSGNTTTPVDVRSLEQLSDVLQLGRSSFSTELVDVSAYRRLVSACDRLPSDLSTFWGVETRLGETRPVVDLLVEIKRGSPGHGLLSGAKPSTLDALVDTWPVWRQIRDFTRRWDEQAEDDFGCLHNLWLEFDIAAAGSDAELEQAVGRPCVFWGPREHSAREPGFFDGLAALLANFYPLWVAPDKLDAIVAALPGDATIFQIGAMGSREHAVLRLCVNRMPVQHLGPWLGAIDWPGNRAALGEALGELGQLVDELAVGIDITAAGVAEKIGIECYLDWSVERVDQWRPLLDYLAQRGLLTHPKRRALEAFPQHSSFGLRQQLRWIRDGVMYPLLTRNIHHIKLAFRDDGFREAKGYLGVYRPGIRLDRIMASRQQTAAERADAPDGWYIR